jgi:riboflavin transporter FmnP
MCLGLAMTAYGIVVVILHASSFSLGTASALVFFVLLFVRRVFPNWEPLTVNKSVFLFDTPLRMFIGGILVYGLTDMAAKIGPSWSGIFAMFPVTGSVLLVFSHVYQGKEFTTNLIHGMFFGWCSISAFCITLSLALPQFGIAVGFGVALVAAIGTQGIAYKIRNR